MTRCGDDNEYIKAAVELADGWEWISDNRLGEVGLPDSRLWYLRLPDESVIYKDALAAQLVRQVDDTYAVWQFPIGVSVSSKDVEDAREFAMVNGPDRTMNTIKVIVDSGVLRGANHDKRRSS